MAFIKSCYGPPNGIVVERDRMNKYGRPLLGCTIKPKLGLSGKNYGRLLYDCLRGRLDFTKDDDNINSKPNQRWQNRRFEFVAEAIRLAEQETGEKKGHYLNVTANTPEEMYERAEFAKELGMPIVMHDFITGGFTANTGLSKWCRKNGMLLHIHRAMHAVIDRHQARHPLRVLAKCLRLSGGDQLHTGTVVGKLEGDRQTTLGYIDQLRESFVPEDRSRGNFFDQDWGSMPGVFAVASGGIHVWHMPALVAIFGDDSVLQFGGGTHGHPWGSAAGAAANRVALEACVKARNAGREIEKESRDILTEAGKHSPELAIAL